MEKPRATPPRPVLLTGATGFVGSHLWPRLQEKGYQVRCLTRRPEEARQRWPERDWHRGDLADRASLDRALAGCGAAYYLTHAMAEGDDFRRQEIEAARRFSAAAEAAGVERIVYLGGIEPAGERSEHLRSRLEVGEALREGGVATTELRASMIVGHGSISWQIIRDLAGRLPAMVLPDWVGSRTEPLALEDLLIALTAALERPAPGSEWWNLPGPEVLTIREILERTAVLIHGSEPVVVEVPDPFPGLSVKVLDFLTGADPEVAEKIAIGMTQHVVANGRLFWGEIGHDRLTGFDAAASAAIAAGAAEGESDDGILVDALRGLERLLPG